MKKKIFIVGGDGFARECYEHLQVMREWESTVEFAGFLGHGGYGHTVDYKTYQHMYLGEVAEHAFKDDEYVVIGAGYPDLRMKIYAELKARKIKFLNLFTKPPMKTAVWGEANVVISTGGSANTSAGIGNVFNGEVIVGHDVHVGDFNFFGPRSQLLGYVTIGNANTIAAGSIVLAHAKIGNNNHIAPLSVIYKGCRNESYWIGNPATKVG